jgi:hypothetical protein
LQFSKKNYRHETISIGYLLYGKQCIKVNMNKMNYIDDILSLHQPHKSVARK